MLLKFFIKTKNVGETKTFDFFVRTKKFPKLLIFFVRTKIFSEYL